MNFLYNKNSHFNLANLITFGNITFGLISIYFITQNSFFIASLFAWLGGAFDIFDGKVARRFNLSTEFGVQLDSFADSITFVLVPTFFIFQAIYQQANGFLFFISAVASIFYVISGLRRLIIFNINTDAGSVGKFFVGVPTPLGAILLWIVYLIYLTGVLSIDAVILLMIIIGVLLNSKIRVPHP